MKMFRLSKVCVLAMAIGILLPSTGAMAGQIWWNDQGPDHKWTTDGNWHTGSAPGAGDVAIFNLNYADPVIVEAGDAISVQSAVIDWSVPEITVNMSGGQIDTFYDVTVGAWAGAGGVVNLTGGTIHTGRSYVIGRDATDGTNPAAYGITNVGNGTITANSHVYVGQGGIGTMTVDHASALVESSYDIFLGETSGARGELNLIHGTIDAGRHVVMGQSVGAEGILNMSGGTINTGGDVRIGESGAGTLTMTGGVINTTGWILVGKEAGSSGTLNLYGGQIFAADLRPHLNDDFLIDITEGSFTVNGDLRPRYGQWIGTHLLAYGGDGDIVMTYEGGKTTVSAIIPEPASMLLLGLGSVFCTMRKKE